MDFIDTYHAAIEAILRASGTTDTVVHVHVGLGLYLLSQLALRTRRGSLDALTVVFACEAANEAMDFLHLGRFDWMDTGTDFAATLFWPTAITLVSLYRRAKWSRRAAAASVMRVSFGRRARYAGGNVPPIARTVSTAT